MMKAQIEAEQDRAEEELERFIAVDDWGKTVDYLVTLAPEPEPTYDAPEPPAGWDDDDDPFN